MTRYEFERKLDMELQIPNDSQLELYTMANLAENIVLQDADDAGVYDYHDTTPAEFLEDIGYEHFIDNYHEIYHKMLDELTGWTF